MDIFHLIVYLFLLNMPKNNQYSIVKVALCFHHHLLLFQVFPDIIF